MTPIPRFLIVSVPILRCVPVGPRERNKVAADSAAQVRHRAVNIYEAPGPVRADVCARGLFQPVSGEEHAVRVNWIELGPSQPAQPGFGECGRDERRRIVPAKAGAEREVVFCPVRRDRLAEEFATTRGPQQLQRLGVHAEQACQARPVLG